MSDPGPLLTADRRAREGGAGVPSYRVRGPLSESLGRSRSPRPAPAASGLTRRERRVKAILLKELEGLKGGGSSWLSYQERKRLAGPTIDVAFIDREIAGMKRQLRPRPVLSGLLALFVMVSVGAKIGVHVGDPLSWRAALDLVIGFALPLSVGATFVLNRRATRRRLWIYQALRELSDAEEEGLRLDESVRIADLLIDRIVDAEEAAARAPLHRIRT